MWFKWESHVTWLSGFAMLVLVYYLGAAFCLVEPQVIDLPIWGAILISLLFLAIMWLLTLSLPGESDWEAQAEGPSRRYAEAEGFAEVQDIVLGRCSMCDSAEPGFH